MNDEIKEIKIIKSNHSIVIIKNGVIVKEQFAIDDEILDYITNLQQENERLNHQLELQQELTERNRLRKHCYKSRIEKAVEYIMSELVDEWSIKNDGCVDGSDLPVNSITPILDILNGRSDE